MEENNSGKNLCQPWGRNYSTRPMPMAGTSGRPKGQSPRLRGRGNKNKRKKQRLKKKDRGKIHVLYPRIQ
jgi:hypothetical protein